MVGVQWVTPAVKPAVVCNVNQWLDFLGLEDRRQGGTSPFIKDYFLCLCISVMLLKKAEEVLRRGTVPAIKMFQITFDG